jgi:NAD(P)-dependent dehydrogenase (short-subunit alcohol dehydrogenase family)
VPDGGLAGAIFLGGLRTITSIGDAIDVNRAGFAAARSVAKAAASGGVFVAVSDLGGSFGVHGCDGTHAWSGGLTALVRTASLEWPDAGVKMIDIERGGKTAEQVAEAIAQELLQGGSEREVGLDRTGRRVTLRNVPVSVQPGSVPLGPSDVVVVTGGGRGVTAACVIELAARSRATFVLLGRSSLVDEPIAHANALSDAELKRSLLAEAQGQGLTLSPQELTRAAGRITAGREIRATIVAIEQAGGQARYLPVDTTDRSAVTEAMATVRRSIGAITGVVHGAGVIADKLIADKTTAQFDAVFDTKVAGLRNLLDATAGDALRILVMFSSVAARTGNTGQADYAMANDVLNRVAVNERVQRPNCIVKSIGWGPWAGGMVTDSLQTHFAERGVDLIGLTSGALAFVDEISSPQTGEVDVVLGGGVGQDLGPFDRDGVGPSPAHLSG